MQHAVDYVLQHWKSLLGWVWLVSGIYLALRIVWQRRAPAATLAWILVLCLVPPLGLLLYHFIGPLRIKRQILRRTRSRALLASANDLEALQARGIEPPVWAIQHSALIQASCGIPPSSCEAVALLGCGSGTFDAILQAVASARDHIHLEYYIFEPDETGRRVLDALVQRLRDGVKVRLLVDGVGSARLLRWRHRRVLQPFLDAGGEFGVFHPTRFVRLQTLLNLRTHRKIVVIDGAVAFTGGINVTDDENEVLKPTDAYRDTHLRLEGAAVRWLQYIFLQDWVYATGKASLGRGLFPEQTPGSKAVHVVASGPDTDGQAIHHAMLHAIGFAQRRILLTTPYFVPTEPAWMALMNAARRGVDVQIMVPQRSDSLLVTIAARSYFQELREAGAKIFEYRHERCLLHAKTLVVDEAYSLIGSANFDNRSFVLNFEVAVALYDTETNTRLAEMFEQDLSHCTLVRSRDQRQPAWQTMAEAVARLLSPLL